ncbi:MAG: FtsQ-type POTRA domain-containing protein [Actinomycetota bacterium]
MSDSVLDELQSAFSDPTPTYDFDDPSIDRMLGLAGDDTDDTADLTGDISVEDTGEIPDTAPPPRRTIVIAESELPDLVYLDEQKEREFYERRDAAAGSSERSTIVIEDLDEFGEIEQLPDRTSGGIDPRIRARRTAVRKAEGRRRLIILGIAAGVVVAIILVIAVLASTLFDVRTVNVQGAVYTDQEVLDEVVAGLKGHAILLVDTHAAEVKLQAVPWVEQATVKTDFPHSVYIDIRERRPIATFQGHDNQFRVIDVQGRVLDVIPGQPVDYMLITGRNPDIARGEFAPAPYASAAQLVVALPTEIRSITTSVGVDTATGGLTMLLSGSVKVRLGDLRNLDEKLARLLGQVRQGLSGRCELDVSTDEVGAVPCP